MSPQFFVPWDNDIESTLELSGGCGRFYVRYLKRVRGRLAELDRDFGRPDAPGSGLARLIDELPGQSSCTAVELMNKHYWGSARPPKRRARRR